MHNALSSNLEVDIFCYKIEVDIISSNKNKNKLSTNRYSDTHIQYCMFKNFKHNLKKKTYSFA